MIEGTRIGKSELYIKDLNLFNSKNNIHLYKKLLSDIELDKAYRFKFEEDRETFILTHGLLRELLGEKIGKNPDKIQFSYNSFGKPTLLNEKYFFNISHTKNFFAIALSDKVPVGIDIENINRDIEWQPIVNSYFTQNEKNWITNFPDDIQKNAFYTIWTRKEAVLKALGVGIVNHLNMIDVVQDVYDSTKIVSVDLPIVKAHWEIKSFTTSTYIVSIAFQQ